MFGLETVLSVLAPFDCLVCETEGALLCAGCCERYIKPLAERCYVCLKSSSNNKVCSHCVSELDHVWVAADYSAMAAQLVKKLKFDRAAAVANILADVMASTLPALPSSTVITYIPTANSRVRQRGYDQARLIARQVAKQKGLPFKLLLKRSGKTRQVGADRTQRHTQLQDAFTATKQLPNSILLVDDVLTTGATIEAAAKALKKAGATEVNAALFAHKSLNQE